MKPAGTYRQRFQHQPMSRTTDSTTNDGPKSWNTNSTTYYYGQEVQQSGQFEVEFGAIRERTEATIRFRGFLTIDTQDQLYGGQFDTLYSIDGVFKDYPNFETVVTAHSLNIS
jgi:hypothetical protein